MSLNNLFISRYTELVGLRAARTPAAHVCPDSTPVLFFGELEKASLLTVGINPSWREFLSESRVPLAGAQRRFAHQSDMTGNASKDSAHAIRRMRAYFRTTPDVAYWQWFRPVQLLTKAFGCSLTDGTAAHTDILSCFATVPPWTQIDPSIHRYFASTGYETFVEVVRSATNVEQVFLLGSRARRAFERNTNVILNSVRTPFDSLPKFRTFTPVLSVADWSISSRRNLRIVAIGPYRNLPLSPLSGEEITKLPDYIYPT